MSFFSDARAAFEQQQQPGGTLADLGGFSPRVPRAATSPDRSLHSGGSGGGVTITGGSGPAPAAPLSDINWSVYFSGLAPTAASLPEVVRRLQARGYDVSIANRGESGRRGLSDDKIIVNGQMYDVIQDVGGANARWLTNPRETQYGGMPTGGAGGTTAGNSPYADGSALAPWTKDFNSPTGEQAMNHPGFQYAMDRAQQAIERSAASKGTLLTGGLLRDLSENQVGMAMQQYGNLRDWMRDDYMIDRDNFFQNQDRPWAKLSGLAQGGRPQ